MPLVSMRGICKEFPGVVANSRVDFDLEEGEIHALLGENGAGKSTLMNILFGLYQPDRGEIYLNGEKVEIPNPRASIDLGIGMVHQHFALVPPFTVAENIILGLRERTGVVLNRERLNSEIKEFIVEFGFDIDPDRKVGDLPVGMQQKVEILKALFRKAKIIILDEPTAVLTPQEVDQLFLILERLRLGGCSIIFITHKLEEVMKVSQRVTVMRLGEVICTKNSLETNALELARLMVGRDIERAVKPPFQEGGEVLLKVEHLSSCESDSRNILNDVSFGVREGEILGVAGVDGNGQLELNEVLTGLRRASSGRVVVCGKDVTNRPPWEVLDAGLAHVPEDRQDRGLALDMSLQDNLVLGSSIKKIAHRFIEPDRIRLHAEELIRTFDIRASSALVAMKTLSGGNQQKAVIAREFSREPRVLLAVKPTRGLDIAATHYVHERLLAEREAKKAVLLTSTELDEILALSDRIIVMFKGRIIGIVPPEVGKGRIGELMAGIDIGFAKGDVSA